MLTVWWARGQANSDELPTQGTICGAGHICCGRRHVRVVGRSRGTALLGPHAIWRLGSLAPKSHQQRLFVVGGLSNFQGGGY